jgi:hypothetical protein
MKAKLQFAWRALALGLLLTLASIGGVALDLPPGSVVIEREPIPESVHVDRQLVLWMISPQRHDRGLFSKQNPYTCPERTRGSYYKGKTRISLVETSSDRVINTVVLKWGNFEEDSFDIPYRILADNDYVVPDAKPGSEGKPKLLALRDFNGDGTALETAFLDAEACMGLLTTLIGYSPARDRVIQYRVELTRVEQRLVKGRGLVNTGKVATEHHRWVDYLFAKKPDAPGHWKYTIDYSGRGGTVMTYEVRYDRARELFVGRLAEHMPTWPGRE